MSRTTRHEPLMGINQLFLLVSLLLIGMLLSVPLDRITLHDRSVAAAVSGVLNPERFPWVSLIFWLVEAATYYFLTALLSRNLAVGFFGLVFGVVIRMLVTTLIAFFLSAPTSSPVGSMCDRIEVELWVYRLLAFLLTVVAIAFPCRRMLSLGFGYLQQDEAPDDRQKAFVFTSAPRVTPHTPYQARPTASAAGNDSQVLAPPSSYAPVTPMENVTGAVQIPMEVIVRCVPEAKSLPHLDEQVPIRLALIVPQLRRSTLWLTWQQIFGSWPDEGTKGLPPGILLADLRNRWVRIPPKYYVSQVPQRYFTVTQTPTAWMQLPEVPQEHQFGATE